MEEDEQEQPEEEITPQKLARLKNLKAFKGWSEQQIRDYIRNKPKKVPKLFTPDDDTGDSQISYDEEEYKRKYQAYHRKYLKEYGNDINDANDAQALEQLVRLVIQSEYADIAIRRLQGARIPDSRTLKNMGDFQRSVQTSINELQVKLGIDRKARKDKQVDDIPQYIRSIQLKAKEFWDRKTEPVQCSKCHIELARYWLNFPKSVKSVNFDIVCTRCKEEVMYSA